jgi:hypothetical protein
MLIQTRSQSHHRRLFGGYHKKVLGYGPIAYWPLWDPSGSTAASLVSSAQNGTYTGVTLGYPGIGDRHTCPYLDGSMAFVNLYTATFASAFNGAEGSLNLWARAYNAAIWDGGSDRYLICLQANGNNYVRINATGNGGVVLARYRAGGTSESQNIPTSSTTDWFALGMTWSKTADKVTYYFNGVQSGTPDTGLGTWSGSLASTQTCLGTSYIVDGRDPWLGYLAHFSVFNSALSAPVMLDLATL